jgi:ATP-dependent DNA helicase RecG
MIDFLSTNIQFLQGVGPKKGQTFEKCNIFTVLDLLNYFPISYLNRSDIIKVKDLYSLSINQANYQPTLIAKLIDKEIIKVSNNKEILKCYLNDGSGNISLTFFNRINYFNKFLQKSHTYIFSGNPKFNYDKIDTVHPDIEEYSTDELNNLNMGKIIPIYSLPDSFKKNYINQSFLRKIVNSALTKYLNYIQDFLPEFILKEFFILDLKKSYYNIHFPENFQLLEKAKTRFKLNEIISFNILMELKRKKYFNLKTNALDLNEKLVSEFIKTLPFELTEGQKEAIEEIKKDLKSTRPMNRLLQGDVGCGKTLVAIISILYALNFENQAAFLVPTELLAVQHYKKIKNLLKNFHLSIELLTGSTPKKHKEQILEHLKIGKTKIIIGTHAILEEKVEFSNLSICIIDEQHRFGVNQRAALIEKGKNPHTLFMSATPIPRTLAMTIYSDLDISVIKTMPANRIPIKTFLRPYSALDKIYQFISDKVLNEGYQAYIIAPLVEESEKLDLNSSIDIFNELSSTNLKHLRLGLLHGKMKWKEKDDIMMQFYNKEIDVLVSTTVIEVGIDVPDANIILILDAHRFGLSQLHQLRGRVGRSNKKAYCILVTTDNIYNKAQLVNPSISPIEDINYSNISNDELSAKRLESMVRTSDGFILSNLDLQLRGPGNILGTQQSGMPEFKVFNFLTDANLIPLSKQITNKIFSNSNNLNDFPLLKSYIFCNFNEQIKFLSIG